MVIWCAKWRGVQCGLRMNTVYDEILIAAAALHVTTIVAAIAFDIITMNHVTIFDCGSFVTLLFSCSCCLC